MLEQSHWFAHCFIYAHCVVCPTIKIMFLFQGKRVSLCFLVAALLQTEQGPPEMRKHSFPQSYPAHEAQGGSQLTGNSKIFNTTEVLGARREWRWEEE